MQIRLIKLPGNELYREKDPITVKVMGDIEGLDDLCEAFTLFALAAGFSNRTKISWEYEEPSSSDS